MSEDGIVYVVSRYSSGDDIIDIEEVISVHASKVSAFEAISLQMKTKFLKFFEAFNKLSIINFQLECIEYFKYIKDQYNLFENANSIVEINNVISDSFYETNERNENDDGVLNKITEKFLDEFGIYDYNFEKFHPWFFEIKEFRLGEISDVHHECESELKKYIKELESKIPLNKRGNVK